MVTLRSDSSDLEARPHSRPRLGPRPPSASGPRSLATTSRRGGRTRARSPVVTNGRLSEGAENPSSAAAAAAAAAKAFSSGGSSSRTSGRGDDRSTTSHGGSSYAPPPPPPYDNYHKWDPAGAPGSDSKRGGGRGSSSGMSSYPPRYGPGYASGYPPDYDRRYAHPPPPHHPHHPHHQHHHHHHHRGPPPPERGGGPPVGSSRGSSTARYPPVDYRYHSRGGEPVRGGGGGSSTPPKGSRGGTSIVLGGATPIHLPKTQAPPPPRPPSQPTPAERPTRASAASVFRHSGRSAGAPPPMDDPTPQKLLMSLRTPSTSFEEKKESDGASLVLSPDDPPKILSSTQQQRAVEMFEKSPDGTRSTTHIDMNPSFTLFNQSFDSFGENYFSVDATMQAADSFGMSRTGSTVLPPPEEPASTLQPNLSNGPGLQVNLSGTNTLLGPSASGHLTIGYSPVNSFGNPTASPKRGKASMMVLGGPGHRSSSPTQVLGMYRSYSGNSGRPIPPTMEDPHMRMPPSNYGGLGPMPPYGRPPPQPYGAEPPYARPPPPPMPESAGNMPPFYVFLRRCRGAFTGCSFLLPGLKAALLEAPTDGFVDAIGPETPYSRHYDASPQDIKIARRRVESSVCAFGGNHGIDTTGGSGRKGADSSSIFRTTEEGTPKKESATVTPSSSVASPPRSQYARSKAKYEEVLPGRYYENESRLSWEFEENPPVEICDEADKDGADGNGDNSSKKNGKNFENGKAVDEDGKEKPPSPQPKMKYRCKLCGQPKQNHTCPYQQSLARSIGVMVYPAVNAFTAAEPGAIAPALSEMNNSVDIKEQGSVSGEPTPRPTPERSRMSPSAGIQSPKHVTPDSMRSSPTDLSPVNTPKTQNRRTSGSEEQRGTKRSAATMNATKDDQGDLLFVESMEIKPQQLITVTPTASVSSADAFTYPALPLPYAQRKRLSDNLFSLSNEVPHLTDECAVVLREAREKDMWDLAVAELITQVLVVTRCTDGDNRVEGLAQYLLTLGISC